MRMDMRRFALWLTLLAVLVGGARLSCVALDPCTNQVAATFVSPDASKKLVVFVRECGATTPFSSQVSLLDRDEQLSNDPGNLFVARLPRGVQEGAVDCVWTNEAEATITYPAASDVYKLVARVDGVSFTYGVEKVMPTAK